jgi:ankyrin repeat and BTB/POZ domain-containing protein 2
MDDLECARKLKIDLAFKMLSSARSDLIPHALQLLPSTKINTVSEHGLTPLMIASIRGDETLAKVLLDAGADVDAETPAIGSIGAQNHPGAYPNPETQHWTALTYSAIQGHLNIAKLLLERGANVEGGARLSEDKCTETPLQVTISSGNHVKCDDGSSLFGS